MVDSTKQGMILNNSEQLFYSINCGLQAFCTNLNKNELSNKLIKFLISVNLIIKLIRNLKEPDKLIGY